MSTPLVILFIFIGLYVLFRPSSSSSAAAASSKTPRDPNMAPNITEISSTAEFDGIVRSLAPTQLLVVDFHAVWCGPCHAIAPVLEKQLNQFPHVRFVKIDVDKQRELAARFRVSAMPTFKFLKGGREIAEMKGANPGGLVQLISTHAGPATQAFSGQGQKLGSSSTAGGSGSGSGSAFKPSAPAAPAEGSLLPQITSKGLTCLNESSSHPITSILGSTAGPKGRSYLESDIDPELLIAIPFNDSVKIKAISIFSGVSPSQAPKTVKLFVNHLAMDFNDAEGNEPAQELVLTPEQVKGEKIELRFVKFQNVRSLHVLIKDNQEDEETTRIDSIDIFGTLGQVTEQGPLPKHDHQ